MARALDDSVRLIAPDLRGRALSADLPGPYGIARHVADAVEVLDGLGLERTVVVGHSMGAYVAAGLAAEHPERVARLVLVDGGHPLPVPEGADPDALLDATLGPAIDRLSMTFADEEGARAFWREHPAFADPGIDDDDLAAWVGHDLTGEPPRLHCAIPEEAVRTDGRDLLTDDTTRNALERVTTPGVLLRAPRGLLNDENAFIPLVQAASFDHCSIQLVEVADTNHYTIIMGAHGARATADAIAAAVV